jgi:hypothetical protein
MNQWVAETVWEIPISMWSEMNDMKRLITVSDPAALPDRRSLLEINLFDHYSPPKIPPATRLAWSTSSLDSSVVPSSVKAFARNEGRAIPAAWGICSLNVGQRWSFTYQALFYVLKRHIPRKLYIFARFPGEALESCTRHPFRHMLDCEGMVLRLVY